MKRTTADLEAAHALAQDQIKEAKANVERLRYSTQKAEETLFELQVKFWILEARLLERDETEKG